MPLHPFFETLHAEAKRHADAVINDPQMDVLTREFHLAVAYNHLLEERGLPPKLICNPTIQLVNGGEFDFIHPERSHYTPQDIATALSKVARMNGHNTSIKLGYSVAQHCVIASWMAPEGYKFEALMHDTSEFVLGDMTTPLKQLCVDYKIIEHRVEQDIARRFHLPSAMSPAVKEVDIRMFATEKRNLMAADGDKIEWKLLFGIEPYDFRITPWSVIDSRTAWLREFKNLWPAHCTELGITEDAYTH